MAGYISPNDPRYNPANQSGYVSPNAAKYGQRQNFQQPGVMQPQQQQVAEQNQQMAAQRNYGNSSIPGVNLLQSLLGREGNPTIPEVKEVPVEVLLQEQQKAQDSGDTERLRNIRAMIERRTKSKPLTSAEQPQKAEAYSGMNPFGYINEALRGDLLGGQQ